MLQQAELELATVFEAQWSQDTLSLFKWFGVVAAIIALGLLISAITTRWRAQLAALAAMWRPFAIVAAAACLLFLNDQGRELGVSLMIEDDMIKPQAGDWVRAAFLLLVLVYWALNNWHSARLGLWRAAKRGLIGVPPANPTGETTRRVTTSNTPWIFWGPRLLGVCAHMLAAASLAIAALNQPNLEGGPLPLIKTIAATSAVLIIFGLTWAVYVADQDALSERGATTGDVSTTARARWWDLAKSVLFTWWIFLLVVTGALFLVAGIAYHFLSQPLHGFVLGSLAISESAVLYLTFISTRNRHRPLGPNVSAEQRQADDAREERRFAFWTLALFAFTLVFVAWTLYDAPAVGRTFGSMVIALFAFGALLATLNGLELTTFWAGRLLFGDRAKPRVFHAYATAAVLALCIVNAWMLPFHIVRACTAAGCMAPDKRLDVASAANVWYQQAKDAYKPNGDDDKAPMLIVATAGGGIRAAYWTAAVLDTLDKELAESGGARPYLFAISGVSGGSVGATAFSAALKDRDGRSCNPSDPRPSDPSANEPIKKDCQKATSYLADDFFAPTLAAWIFKDTLASVLPWPVEDRQAALEKGFEHASVDEKANTAFFADSFLSFFNKDAKFETATLHSTWLPILLLNATHEETGKRIIASQVKVEREVFVDAYDELDVLGGDLRASTAAMNSARFTYVSPAGNLGPHRGSVIDGGYFENYGALTALELADAVRASPLGDKVKVVLLMITSDPTLGKEVGNANVDRSATLVRIEQAGEGKPCVVSATEHDPDPARNNGPNFLPVNTQDSANPWLNEFVAPLQGITTVRGAHGNRAAAQLAVQTCADYPKPVPTSSEPDASSASKPSGAANRTRNQISYALQAGRDVYPRDITGPAQQRPGLPYFAHVGMCQSDEHGPIKVTPPLGWVLSKATRTGLNDLVHRCGNREQLEEVKQALNPHAARPIKTP